MNTESLTVGVTSTLHQFFGMNSQKKELLRFAHTPISLVNFTSPSFVLSSATFHLSLKTEFFELYVPWFYSCTITSPPSSLMAAVSTVQSPPLSKVMVVVTITLLPPCWNEINAEMWWHYFDSKQVLVMAIYCYIRTLTMMADTLH